MSTAPVFGPEQVKRLNAALGSFGRAYAKVVREQVVPALKRFDAAMWSAYRKAGAPYGDTPEGRERWVRELSAAARAEREAEYQRMRDLPIRLPRRA